MSAINGTTLILDVDDNPLAMLTDTTLNVEQDLPDASNKSSGGWADHINGLRSWSIDVDGHASLGSTGNYAILLDLVLDRANVSIEFASTASGSVKVTGTVSLASFSIGSPSEDTATVSGSLTGKGAITKAIVS